MANQNPTGSGDAVALTIASNDLKFLRRLFTMARDGVREEVAKFADRLKEPVARLRREAAGYDRLLAGLDGGSIVPDRDLCDLVFDLAVVIDHGNEHARVVAEHAALWGLLGQLKGRGEVA
jgi:hypothetical protein